MGIWSFGVTVAVIGMAGTLLVLWLMAILIWLLKKIFPEKSGESPSLKG